MNEKKVYHVNGIYMEKAAQYEAVAIDIVEAIKEAQEYGYINFTEAYLVKGVQKISDFEILICRQQNYSSNGGAIGMKNIRARNLN